MPRRFIVVPESLEFASGKPLARPSFIYRQVLDWVIAQAEAGDEIYLAPANNYGGSVTEEQAADEYLRQRAIAGSVYCPGRNLGPYAHDGAYVDTWGNAERLARWVDRARGYDLVAGEFHARRAEWCFRKVGFRIERVIAVPHRVQPGGVVWRNAYYKSRLAHRLYEWAAYLRDRIVYR
jgi:uncharacterized SAM-binding protein YcdF (DUF218 family)